MTSGVTNHIDARPKKARGLGKSTIALRSVLAEILRSDEGPWTVRQLFYACSVREAVEKSEAGYCRVQQQVLLMRREGLISYGDIADNTRWVRKPPTYDSVGAWAEHSISTFRLDLWRDNHTRVQVWLEKDALAGVVYDVTDKWHVPLLVTRGYSSESFAYSAAENINEDDRITVIYYLGDFDPSGVNAAEDLERRLRGFLNGKTLIFERIAVTPEQIETLQLPSRPTKTTDTRHKDFEKRFGGMPSTELDSIEPWRLRKLVEKAILDHVDQDQITAIQREESKTRKSLQKTLGKLCARGVA